jgi:cation diffusion facilitator CzcD-associated flavoprotein CzcO
MPNIPGVGSFTGQSCHTHRWPKEGVDFAGKRVGIIGTGATAVQTIQEIAKTVGHLTVFQRTPNWCAPLHNRKVSEEESGTFALAIPKSWRAAATHRAATSMPRTRGLPAR